MAVPPETVVYRLVALGDGKYCQQAKAAAGRIAVQLEGSGGSTRGEDGVRGDQGGQHGSDGKDGELHECEIEKEMLRIVVKVRFRG